MGGCVLGVCMCVYGGFERSRQCYDSAARNDLSGKHQGCEGSGLGLSVGYLGRFLRVRGDGGYEVSKTAICEICVLGRTQTSSHLSSVSLGGGETCQGTSRIPPAQSPSHGRSASLPTSHSVRPYIAHDLFEKVCVPWRLEGRLPCMTI